MTFARMFTMASSGAPSKRAPRRLRVGSTTRESSSLHLRRWRLQRHMTVTAERRVDALRVDRVRADAWLGCLEEEIDAQQPYGDEQRTEPVIPHRCAPQTSTAKIATGPPQMASESRPA